MKCCWVGPLMGDLVDLYVWNEQRHSHLSTATRSHILIIIVNFFHSIIHTKGKKIIQEKTSPAPLYLSSPDMWNRVAHLPFSYELQEEEEEEIPSHGVEHN
ncbi:hypothetical protein CR513_11133, partial [Mucuna pruriens]